MNPLHVAKLICTSAALLILAACGGPSVPPPEPEPEGAQRIEGSVTLPAGHGLDLAQLLVVTPIGSYPVASDGAFSADIYAGSGELGLQTSEGELLLLGANQGGAAELSLASSAEALLYYLVGGPWIGADQQASLRALLAGSAAADPVAAELTRQLLAGGNGLAEPDAGTLSALEAAAVALVPTVSALRSPAEAAPAHGAADLLRPAAMGDNLVIQPSATVQAGAQVLHNPTGSGVVAQNHIRRPAALLAYQVEWTDVHGTVHPIDPPFLEQTLDVPATGQLELLQAIVDVFTAGSPWSPVLSERLALPGREGAARTRYELVLLGPSLTDASWPISSDPRFEAFHDAWDDIVLDKTIELFLEELVLPLIEVYGLGKVAKFDAAKLRSMRERVRIIHDPYLAQLGVFLAQGSHGYVNGLKFVIQELATNRTYRLDMLGMVADALAESDRNLANIQAIEGRLAARASTTAILAAVEAVLVSGDVTKILYDLAGAPEAVSWTVDSAPTLFALTPDSAVVTRNHASARFKAFPRGPVNGHFLYRWSTSGSHGAITDLLAPETKDSFVTTSAEAWYFHDYPVGIEDDHHDTVTVEVFEVEEGVTTLPSGAQPIARMAAEVRGRNRHLDGDFVVLYDTTPPGYWIEGRITPCVAMYLAIPVEPGTRSYRVVLSGTGGVGNEKQYNNDLQRSAYNVVDFAPSDTTTWRPFEGACNWPNQNGTGYTLPPSTLFPYYDPDNQRYLLHINTIWHVYWVHAPVDLGAAVDQWYGWMEGADIEITFQR